MSDNPFFNNIEKKTGVNMGEVLKLAQSLQSANFKDEKTVRDVIQKVSKIANKPVSKEKEEQIVQAILKNNMPLDLASLTKMFDKK
ncbi:sporulation protein [Lottiidibacillus patelloidae]|uniref:Sporulation protein n=1 Tax=Lottiidibacillus patelloidae TaxID=2670334 RepID=A0A263BZH1_9BACI|nr:stage VI sporulation protein F [Lottiidibacillus patelloidae]OZM58667.1 sporulation protein [Lottiidibacillus patelloidae]